MNQTNPLQTSRSNDASLLAEEEQNLDHKADRADASIAKKVDRALWNNSVLRSTDYHEIDVVVEAGVVTLSGHVIGVANQQSAEAAVRTVPAVKDVRNHLVPDDQLVSQVAVALGKIERVYGGKFFTGARNGVVVLNGEVGSPKVRSLAERCAASIPRVRGVMNNLRSTGDDDSATKDRRFLQPAIGEQIYYRDGLLGTVKKVIINPDNRRVVAMIVQRQPSSNLRSGSASLMSDKTLQPEALVVIPVKIIRYMPKQSSGFLHLHSTEIAKYMAFDPAFFAAPEKDWTPPYPYCPDDVLFVVDPFRYRYEPAEEYAGILPAILPG